MPAPEFEDWEPIYISPVNLQACAIIDEFPGLAGEIRGCLNFAEDETQALGYLATLYERAQQRKTEIAAAFEPETVSPWRPEKAVTKASRAILKREPWEPQMFDQDDRLLKARAVGLAVGAAGVVAALHTGQRYMVVLGQSLRSLTKLF